MEREVSSSRGYHIAVNGMKMLIKVLLLICVAIALVLLSRSAYKLGYQVFYQQPVDSGEGRAVQINITADMSAMEIGEVLKDAGLLEEEPIVFRLQEMASDYHNKILPGTYTLRTSMTADEMLRVMAGEGDEVRTDNDSNQTENVNRKEIV